MVLVYTLGPSPADEQSTQDPQLKGESSGQACQSYMIVNVIVMDRQNFSFHLMIFLCAGGLPSKIVLA